MRSIFKMPSDEMAWLRKQAWRNQKGSNGNVERLFIKLY